MNDLPAEIYCVADVRSMDRRAIDVIGIPGYRLMCRAAEAAYDAIHARYPSARNWTIVCGAGNNAGDGYVLGRLARMAGIGVKLISLTDPETLSGDAATARDEFVDDGGRIGQWSGHLDAGAELVIDAILGIGLDRALNGVFAEAVEAINDLSVPVVSLDIPTGIHGDTGVRMGSAVRAAMTVTFVGLKTGLFLADGISAAGELVFSGLDIPADCRKGFKPRLRRITGNRLARWLPPRARDSNKGDFGHVVVIGGQAGMAGAVILAGMAALRAGAGKVTIATHPNHADRLALANPELMARAIVSAADLEPLLASADVIAAGPGLGQTDWSVDLLSATLVADRPSVWDADALNLLAAGRIVGDTRNNRVLTPHPGEAGRLLGRESREIQRDRITAVREVQQMLGGVAVLKGACTLVYGGQEPPAICTAGNPGMAAAGMGDVLTGVTAAMLAQGLDAYSAACAAVSCHAHAGDLAARDGERGMLASDVLANLRSAVNCTPGPAS